MATKPTPESSEAVLTFTGGCNMVTMTRKLQADTAGRIRVEGLYTVIDGPGSTLGRRLVDTYSNTKYAECEYHKFPDQSDDIHFPTAFDSPEGFADQRILFCASFHSNDAIMQCLHVLIMLLESHIKDLTIVVPFLPCATMERVDTEGVVATANTTSRLLSLLPSCGRPTRIIFYDLHTQHQRFYFHKNAIADLRSVVTRTAGRAIHSHPADVVFFPDSGAAKRFGSCFPQQKATNRMGYCSKVRGPGDERHITLHGGVDVKGQIVWIVDDLVRTGGTLKACALELQKQGAKAVIAYCVHAAGSVEEIMALQQSGIFEQIHLTNTVKDTTDEVLTETKAVNHKPTPVIIHDILPCFAEDLWRTQNFSRPMW